MDSTEIIHSQDCLELLSYIGKTVVLIGIRNSSCDIAADLNRVSKKVFFFLKSEAVVVKKVLLECVSENNRGFEPDWS